MEENETIEENIIGNIEGDNIRYEFSELSSNGIQFKSFYYKKAYCFYIYYQSVIDTIILHEFVNYSRGTTDGRKLFCFTLRWIKTNLPQIIFVSLCAVPLTLKKGEQKISQEILNLYYKKIGFKEIGENDFKENIDILIENCKVNHMGGKSRRRSRRRSRRSRRSRSRISRRNI